MQASDHCNQQLYYKDSTSNFCHFTAPRFGSLGISRSYFTTERTAFTGKYKHMLEEANIRYVYECADSHSGQYFLHKVIMSLVHDWKNCTRELTDILETVRELEAQPPKQTWLFYIISDKTSSPTDTWLCATPFRVELLMVEI